MNDSIKPIGRMCPATIGALPTSYLISLSYEEQLIYLCNKMDEMINFLNNNITAQLREYINNEFNNMMINTMYIPETETLVLYLDRSGS